ncbi:MAG: hypothetical protein WC799_19835 [Desulfobacteraceae bacterium]|jgi:hypothetical protein
MSYFQLAVIVAVTMYTLAQIIDAHAEYLSPFWLVEGTGSWGIHHDEKLIVPDARYLYLKNKLNSSILDYTYPVSAAFGVAGPAIALTGFKMFGLNTFGLRFPFIVISGLSNLFVCLCIMEFLPGYGGVILSMTYLINYKTFIFSRHAILENILILALVSTFFFYLTNPSLFITYGHVIGFIAGVLTLVKINFPVYFQALMLAVYMAENQDLSQILILFCWSGCGYLISEIVQAVFLMRMGIARYRYGNLVKALVVLTGGNSYFQRMENRYNPMQNQLSGFKVKPTGLSFFWEILMMFNGWFYPLAHPWRHLTSRIDPVNYYDSPLFLMVWGTICRFFTRCAMVFKKALVVPALAMMLFWAVNDNQPGQVRGVMLFLVLFLLISAPFYLYIKRVVPAFPFCAMLLGYAISLTGKPVFMVLAFAMTSLIAQIVQLKTSGAGLRVVNRDNRSKDLEKYIAPGETVYAFSYALRFFWQTETIRWVSADEQYMNNQHIIDLALKNGSGHVLLSSRGHLPERSCILKLRAIATYHTSPAESDFMDVYTLFHLEPTTNTDLAVNPSFSQDELYLLRLEEAWGFYKMSGGRIHSVNTDSAILKTLEKKKENVSAHFSQGLVTVMDYLENDVVPYRKLDGFWEDLFFKQVMELGCIEKGMRYIVKGYGLNDLHWYEAVANMSVNDNHISNYSFHPDYIEFLFKLKSDHQKPGLQKGRFRTSLYGHVFTHVYRWASRIKANGELSLSQTMFTWMERLEPSHYGPCFHLGEICLSSGQSLQSESYFRKCLDLNPGHIKAKVYLGL